MDTPSSDRGGASTPPTPPAAKRPRNNLKLWLVLALCAAPVIASFTAYFWLRPAGRVNYGELLPLTPLPQAALTGIDGHPFSLADLKGSWVLLVADKGACDEPCVTKLVYTRQIRLAQGKNADRVRRVWLVTDDPPPNPRAVAEQPDLQIVRASRSALLGALPAERDPAAHVYVVDPLGNLMMRFPENADPRKMLKDVSRLLRYSQ